MEHYGWQCATEFFPARYGLPGMHATEDIMTGTLEGAQAQTVLAVDISELDTKLVTAKEGNKLYGIVYNNTSGIGSLVNNLY